MSAVTELHQKNHPDPEPVPKLMIASVADSDSSNQISNLWAHPVQLPPFISEANFDFDQEIFRTCMEE